jgi:hypothetical protein
MQLGKIYFTKTKKRFCLGIDFISYKGEKKHKEKKNKSTLARTKSKVEYIARV